ncbi:trypsin-like serine peptidase [Pontimicrobium sp. MEBiC01747]
MNDKLKGIFYYMVVFLCIHYSTAQQIQDLNPGGHSDIKNININDSLGTQHQDYKRSVSYIDIDDNGNCTCTLLNTVNQNGKYYIVTAAHCLQDSNGAYSDTDDEVSILFSFNYEAMNPKKRTENGIKAIEITAKVLNIIPRKDLALLELDILDIEDQSFIDNLYFSGWSIDMISKPEKIIGHPEGDLKKIYKLKHTPSRRLRVNMSKNFESWSVKNEFFNGTKMEPGTSGAAWLNSEKKVIAITSGGAGFGNVLDAYGSLLSNGWFEPNGAPLLQKYLDPSNTYASNVIGGYGLDNGKHIINESKFDLQLQVNESFKTPSLNEGVDKMIKLNLWELNQLKNETSVGGIYRKSGNIQFKIITYLSDNLQEPRVLYSTVATGDGIKKGEFEVEEVTPLSSATINEILMNRGVSESELNRYEYNLPVVLEVKNASPEENAIIRALKIPGLGYRNAVELFKPEEFKALYKNANYPENRGLQSSSAYIDSLHIKIKKNSEVTGASPYKTENNGGYVNLIQHRFPALQPGSEVELTFSPKAMSGTLHYSVWVDYDKDYKFNGLGEHVVTGITGTHQETPKASFIIPEDFVAPIDGFKTRIRIAMREGAPPLSDGSGVYDVGEVEDYTVAIYPKNDNSTLLATAVTTEVSSPSVLVNTKGQCAAVSADQLKWLPFTDDKGNSNYSVCDQLTIQKSSKVSEYTLFFSKKKKYLDIDLRSVNKLTTFNNHTLLTKTLRTVSDTTALKLYSFQETVSGNQITYYGFQNVYNEQGVSLPYQLLTVSEITSLDQQNRKVTHPVNNNEILAGSIFGGSIVTGLTIYGVFQKVNTPRATINNIGGEQDIELESLIPGRETESAGTPGTQVRRRPNRTNVEESCESEL